MKKRILSIVLTLCIVLMLVPTTIFAEGAKQAMQFGTDCISQYDEVYYGVYTEEGEKYEVPWYALDTNGFLLSKYTLGTSHYRSFQDQDWGFYEGSDIQTVMDGLYNGENTMFTSLERSAVKATTLSADSMCRYMPTAEGMNPPSDLTAYLFPLSKAETEAIKKTKEIILVTSSIAPTTVNNRGWYYLRTAYSIYCNVYCMYNNDNSTGVYEYITDQNPVLGARPSFNLDLSTVLFTSAATGGKSSGECGAAALQAVPSTEITEWKLTLKDTARNFATDRVAYAGNIVTVDYSGAMVGTNEYISAIIVGNDGSIKYYGNVAKPESADGTLTIDLSGVSMASGDTLKIFSEQCNGDKLTDYASEPVAVSFEPNAYSINNTLTNVTTSNPATYRLMSSTEDYAATLSTDSGNLLTDITVKIGGVQYTTITGGNLNANITIPCSAITGHIEIIASAIPQEATPNATFTAIGDNSGTLSGIDTSMKYSVDGGKVWNDVTGDNMSITEVSVENDVKVYKPGNGTTSFDSEVQTIDVTQASQPTGIYKTDCTTAAQNNGTIINVDDTMEYKLSTADGWTAINGNTVKGLTNGTYYVRVKASGSVLASSYVTVAIGAHTCTDAAPKDHLCDICGETISQHTGGEATCTSKAVCKYCDKEYGELDSSNHTGGTETRGYKSPSCTEAGYTGDTYCKGCGAMLSSGGTITKSAHNLENIPAKDATVTETGNKEYWQCKDCKQCFSDKDGKNTIELKDTVTQKLSPEIIEGTGQSITEGEKKELTFRSNAAFGDFIRVELDGETLDEKNYTVKEGSTVVTLKADYAAALSVGEHTVGIVSESGTATTTFTVKVRVNAWDKTVLRPQASASKTSIKIKWNAVPEADGYVIYWNQCGAKSAFKQIKVINSGKTLTWTHKGLKKGSLNKYYVKAYKMIGNKKQFIKTSKQIHLATEGGKYTNVKKLQSSISSVTLKKGQTKALKVTSIYAERNKKPVTHMRTLAYTTSNKKVASVTAKGVIKAEGKGSCYIYITASSGVYTRVKVVVK